MTERLTTFTFLIFLFGLADKESACNPGDMSWIPGSRRSAGEGNGSPFQNSCLKNPMDRGTWWTIVHGVTQSRTRLNRLSSSSSRIATHPSIIGFLGSSVVKHPPSNAGVAGTWDSMIPVLGRSPGGGNDNPLQYCCLENPMDRGLPSMGSQRVRPNGSH